MCGSHIFVLGARGTWTLSGRSVVISPPSAAVTGLQLEKRAAHLGEAVHRQFADSITD